MVQPNPYAERVIGSIRIEVAAKCKVIAIPQVGGLHHRYRRAA
jgi:hypothetical protein